MHKAACLNQKYSQCPDNKTLHHVNWKQCPETCNLKLLNSGAAVKNTWKQ